MRGVIHDAGASGQELVEVLCYGWRETRSMPETEADSEGDTEPESEPEPND